MRQSNGSRTRHKSFSMANILLRIFPNIAFFKTIQNFINADINQGLYEWINDTSYISSEKYNNFVELKKN